MTAQRRATWKVRTIPVLAAACLLLAACGGGAGGKAANVNAGAAGTAFDKTALRGEGKKIVLFTYAPANKYISVYTESLRTTLESQGYRLQVFTNSFSQSQEDQQVQQYLASGEKPALFLWIPFDDKGGINSTRLLSRVAPVVQLNAPLLPEGEQYVAAYSGNNSYQQGRLMGEIMNKARDQAVAAGATPQGGNGNLLVFHGSASNQSSRERYRGFTDATKDRPFTVLDQSNNLTPDEAYRNGLALVPKYQAKGIDFVWVFTDTTAAGVLRALAQSGVKPGTDVRVVGGNCGDPAQLLDGSEYGTTLQVAFVEGTAAAYTAMQFLASGNKVIDGEVTLPATAELPEIPLTPPHKYNYIPLRTVIGVDEAKSVRLWGKPVTELCVG